MRRIVVRLDQSTREALGRLAAAERRLPSDQAAILIERSLAQTAQHEIEQGEVRNVAVR